MNNHPHAEEVEQGSVGEKKKISLQIRRLEKIETTSDRSLDS
ncbi:MULTISPECIES: hypothetical protein [unclassified Nonomuraea]|nr:MULTISPECIES: hypothetical protein [unclassified Nonomuraea]